MTGFIAPSYILDSVAVTVLPVVAWQLGVLFDVVLLIGVQSRDEERPQRFLGRCVQQRVHLSDELRYVPAQPSTRN